MSSVGDGPTQAGRAIARPSRSKSGRRTKRPELHDKAPAKTKKPKASKAKPKRGPERSTVPMDAFDATPETFRDGPKAARHKSTLDSRRPVKRMSHKMLCKKLPSRPYLAVLGVSEPPPGYPIRHHIITLGRGKENQITIQDSKTSRGHALFAAVGRDIVLIDMESRRGTFVNCRKIVQAKLRPGDVIDMGQHRFVFAVVPGPELLWGYDLCPLWAATAPTCPKAEPGEHENVPFMGDVIRTADEDDSETHGPPARLVLTETDSSWCLQDEGRAVLIGQHEVCHFRPETPGVAMFHAQFYWASDGIHLRDLRSPAGTFVNGAPIDDVAVSPGDEISVGQAKLGIQFYGDVAGRCEHLARQSDALGPLALTCVDGLSQGVSANLPRMDRPIILGRDHQCDLCLADPRVSSRHASLTVGDDHIEIKDLGARNKIRMAGKTVTEATLKPGNTIWIGKSEFLVHYSLSGST